MKIKECQIPCRQQHTYRDKSIIVDWEARKELCIEVLFLYIWKCLIHKPHCITNSIEKKHYTFYIINNLENERQKVIQKGQFIGLLSPGPTPIGYKKMNAVYLIKQSESISQLVIRLSRYTTLYISIILNKPEISDPKRRSTSATHGIMQVSYHLPQDRKCVNSSILQSDIIINRIPIKWRRKICASWKCYLN